MAASMARTGAWDFAGLAEQLAVTSATPASSERVHRMAVMSLLAELSIRTLSVRTVGRTVF